MQQGTSLPHSVQVLRVEETAVSALIIYLCKCDGSMKFIHLTCLQEWLDSKRVSQKLEGVYSYYWEELVCELCKEPLALNNISASGDKTKNTYLLNFKQPKNKIQSAEGSIMTSPSVTYRSRGSKLESSYICKVYVEDCNSKFGTFVKVNGAIPIPKTHRLPIQIEKKIFFFKLEQRFSCFQLCMISCGLPVKTSAEGKTLKEEQHEHYHEVIDKFPEELEQLFFPPLPPQYGHQSHTVPVKPNESQHTQNGPKNYNRVMDESVITQMSVQELGKLKNNLAAQAREMNLVSGPGAQQSFMNLPLESRSRVQGNGGPPSSHSNVNLPRDESLVIMPSEGHSQRSSRLNQGSPRSRQIHVGDPYGMNQIHSQTPNQIKGANNGSSQASLGINNTSLSNPFQNINQQKLPPIINKKNRQSLILSMRGSIQGGAQDVNASVNSGIGKGQKITINKKLIGQADPYGAQNFDRLKIYPF